MENAKGKALVIKGLREIGEILADMPDSPETEAVFEVWRVQTESILRAGPEEAAELACASSYSGTGRPPQV